MEAGKLSITPFNGDQLAPTAYRLCPHRVKYVIWDDDGFEIPQVTVLSDKKTKVLRPGEYVVVSPQEHIELGNGLIADFYPSSWCAERNLLVSSGRLDAGYTSELVFGVYNASRYDVELTKNFQLVRATFAWLGEHNMPTYSKVPGAYLPQLNKLRQERKAALDRRDAEASRLQELEAQIAEISKKSGIK